MEFVLGLLVMVAEMTLRIAAGLGEILLGLIAAAGQRRTTRDEQ